MKEEILKLKETCISFNELLNKKHHSEWTSLESQIYASCVEIRCLILEMVLSNE